MPEFCKLFIDHLKRHVDGMDIYIGVKGRAFEAHLDFFQELSLNLSSTMGPWDEPTVQHLGIENRAFLFVTLKKLPAFYLFFHPLSSLSPGEPCVTAPRGPWQCQAMHITPRVEASSSLIAF
jgi:hypothetical protein